MDILRAPPQRYSRNPALVFLVWIAISGTLPMHIFVPALPMAARELQATPAAMQWSITAYLIGMSLGQLVLGIFSDRFGRRPVLLAGMLIYLLSSILAAVSPNLSVLIVARVLQAIGGCAGLVLGRAITRDSAGPARAAAQMAVLGASISIGPALAPIIGGQLAEHLGWRSIFVFLAVVNTALLLTTTLTLPETHPPRGRIVVRDYMRRYFALLRTPRFLQFCIGGAFATTSFFAFVGSGPFILKERFHLSVNQVGLVFLVVVASLTVGSLLTSRLARTVQPPIMLRISVSLMTVSGLALVGFAVADGLTLWSLLLPTMLLTFSIGLCSAFAMTGAINVDASAIGAASGLYGCMQMAVGALILAAVSLVPTGLETAMSIVILIAALIALLAFWLPLGHPPEPLD